MLLGKPQYKNAANTRHDNPRKIGILLANLGSPDAPNAKALRSYLRTFLSDPRVIELPRFLWLILLNIVIVPFRSPKSAKAYQEVWTAEGSPLVIISKRQAKAISEKIKDLPVVVELGMSYGNPSIKDALDRLHEQNCSHLLVLPLYPQYAASTIGSVFDSISRVLSSWRLVPHLNFIAGYSTKPQYIKALVQSIQEHQKEHGKPKLLVFSFHGTQLSTLEKGDPYHCQCHLTARETAETLGLEKNQWLVTFQSRFGADPWLQPYTIKVMEKLPKQNIDDIQIVCPAFSADCLETLEEIKGKNQGAFKEAGGKKFSYIPALNDNKNHIDFLATLIRDHIKSWSISVNLANEQSTLKKRSDRADEIKPYTQGKKDIAMSKSND